MKISITALFIACISLFLFTESGIAQDQIAVPLSNPGQPGQLSLNMIRGSMEITGYDGDEVVIRHNGQHADPREREETRDGMRRLTGPGRGFEVQERNNNVSISGISPADNIEFEILVPYNFSLNLSMVNGSKMHVERVDGVLEMNNVNGGITLTDVGGCAILNTVNGEIKATFRSVEAGKLMAFSNVNGDIDVTLPADTQFSGKMKSDLGDVFTDFDMEITSDSDNTTFNIGAGSFSMSINKWIHADANGGGPEYLFKTLRGDIMIRSR